MLLADKAKSSSRLGHGWLNGNGMLTHSASQVWPGTRTLWVAMFPVDKHGALLLIRQVGGGVIEVLSTGGHANLGGDDWDAAIMQWLVEEHLKPARVDCTVRRAEDVWKPLRAGAAARASTHHCLPCARAAGSTPRGQPARSSRGSQDQAEQRGAGSHPHAGGRRHRGGAHAAGELFHLLPSALCCGPVGARRECLSTAGVVFSLGDVGLCNGAFVAQFLGGIRWPPSLIPATSQDSSQCLCVQSPLQACVFVVALIPFGFDFCLCAGYSHSAQSCVAHCDIE